MASRSSRPIWPARQPPTSPARSRQRRTALPRRRSGAPPRHGPPSRRSELTDIRPALESALTGGPERHHAKVSEQGKLPVRDRVARLVDPESFAEEALLANWEQEGLGADGVVTGL